MCLDITSLNQYVCLLQTRVTMPAFKIKVKWGKEVFSDVEVSFLFKDDNLRV